MLVLLDSADEGRERRMKVGALALGLVANDGGFRGVDWEGAVCTCSVTRGRYASAIASSSIAADWKSEYQGV